ncbi:17-beta-hydroxysteroid dehydrogenase 14 [Colletotrichum trifolii]|uniref:17-beta-hydroxysteroid dehydrogenase 14 n=1 Tax=Colletotrichum trifolii TaxID=5466 RepID=A0A4R8RC55_COLTR|nr:17-beta-hydroxysteroid dehydrogenase 14 [Colletotrichum trifolii]
MVHNAVVMYGTFTGIGSPDSKLNTPMMVEGAKAMVLWQIFYVSGSLLIKTSICATLIRIATHRRFKYAFQISSLWDTALQAFPQVDIVCNGAGLYEPPASSFWNPPGVSPLAEDPADAKVGQYRTFSVNTIAPIRLAQIAIDYWLQNRAIQGNLLWIASLGGYVHSIHTPMYFASKAAIVSMVKSLGGLRKEVGIRNAAVCPGAVYTPIFHPEYCRDRIRSDDLTMTPEQCASVMLRVLTEAEFGDGNVMEVMLLGNKKQSELSVREVPLHLLYPSCGAGEDNHLLEEEQKMVKGLKEHGMRPQV